MDTSLSTAGERAPIVLVTAPRRRRRDRAARAAFLSAAVATFVVTVLIILTLVTDSWEFLSKLADEDGLGRLTDIGWFPRRGLFDISTLVTGTLMVTGIAMLVAVPLGLGTAVYLAEYARPGLRKVIKPIIEVLAGIPSVVLGYFAISFINPNLIVATFSGANRAFTLAAAGVVLQALMRQPRATPFTLGVSAGAALGRRTGIVVGRSGGGTGLATRGGGSARIARTSSACEPFGSSSA
jgi:phosphate transport system permease protein